MLMWATGLLFVPGFEGWCGLPFLVLGAALLFLWVAQWKRGEVEDSGGAFRTGVAWLGAEELVVGALSGLAIGGPTAGPGYFDLAAPAWVGPVLLGIGVLSFTAASAHGGLPEWLLPVRGRWARRLLGATGTAALFAISPCWAFLAMLWSVTPWNPDPVQLLAARAATVVLGLAVLLYTGTFVAVLGDRGISGFLRSAPVAARAGG